MSADEFDPYVERLFARSPEMADAVLFNAGVEAKLQSGTRVRTLALTLAGLVGGAIAVREMVNVDVDLAASNGPVAGRAVAQGVQALSANAQTIAQNGLDQLGLANLSLGSMGGMQLFWITAGALIALAAAGVMRLSQES